MRTCDPKRGQQILDAAAQLFATHRYHEVRMDDIAEHAGVAKGTVYRYFHDKEDLYLALTRHGLIQLLDESRAIIEGAAEPDEKLRGFITHIVRFYEQYPYFLELIQRIETSNSPESVNTLNEIRTQYYHALTDLMTQLKQTDQPRLAAMAAPRYHPRCPALHAAAVAGTSR